MICRLSDIKMLKWIYYMQIAHLAPNSVLQEDPKDTPFIEKYIGEGALGKHCSV